MPSGDDQSWAWRLNCKCFSQASLVGLAGHISYASSKGAVDAAARVSALELGKYDLSVNAVNPTVVMTPMSKWYSGGGHWRPTLEAMPLTRWATEEDCAAPIVFLLSDASAMVQAYVFRLMAALRPFS